MKKQPKYVHGFVDRHGKPRFYLRHPGHPRIALPGLPWSTEFMAAYDAALAGETLPQPAIGESRTLPGTINALVVAYYNSAGFKSLEASTQATYRGIIERFRSENGHRSVAGMTRAKIVEMLGNRAATPAAANNWLRMVRTLMQFALTIEVRADDPTAGIKSIKVKSTGFKTWGSDYIEQYRAHHKTGTRARLALELLLNVGMRRSDVVRIGKPHLKNGEFSFRTQKTKTLIEGVPLFQSLATELEQLPPDSLAFLMTDFGKCFTPAGFGNWFREQCDAAKIPKGFAAHGVRKACATNLAENGATAHQLMAWFGWSTLKEAQRYTMAANKKKLTQGAAATLKAGTLSGKPQE